MGLFKSTIRSTIRPIQQTLNEAGRVFGVGTHDFTARQGFVGDRQQSPEELLGGISGISPFAGLSQQDFGKLPLSFRRPFELGQAQTALTRSLVPGQFRALSDVGAQLAPGFAQARQGQIAELEGAIQFFRKPRTGARSLLREAFQAEQAERGVAQSNAAILDASRGIAAAEEEFEANRLQSLLGLTAQRTELMRPQTAFGAFSPEDFLGLAQGGQLEELSTIQAGAARGRKRRLASQQFQRGLLTQGIGGVLQIGAEAAGNPFAFL